MEHKHMWLMMGVCLLSLLIAFFAPRLGFNGQYSFLVVAVFMILAHLFMIRHHATNDKQNSSHCKSQERKPRQ